jgi:hypothetical protein
MILSILAVISGADQFNAVVILSDKNGPGGS